MTRCEFFTEEDRITGFSVSGHSGYAEAGADIVCAAISAVIMVIALVMTMMGMGRSSISCALANSAVKPEFVSVIMPILSMIHSSLDPFNRWWLNSEH